MSIAVTVKDTTVFGNKKIVFGTYTASSDTAGVVSVGVIPIFVEFKSTTTFNVGVTMGTSSRTVTLATETGDTGGSFIAIGI
jgi:hypothetical protein